MPAPATRSAPAAKATVSTVSTTATTATKPTRPTRPTSTSPPTASVLLNRLVARAKFRHVQVLLRLAELGSVQRAADAIGLTQSSVTQTLAYLESLLEARLFQRHARGVTPTAACTDLLPVARQMMIGLAEAADRVRAHQRQDGGTVRLLASLPAVHGLLLQGLPPFHQRHPGVQVHLRHAEGEDLLLAVARGEVDLVACRQPAAVPEGWRFDALQPDRLVVVCAPGHPVLRRRRPDWDALARETWLLAPVESLARLRFDELACHLHPAPRIHPLVSRLYPLTLHLLQTEGVLALLPHSFARPDLDAGRLAVVPTPAGELALEPMGLMRPAALALGAEHAGAGATGAVALLATHLMGLGG